MFEELHHLTASKVPTSFLQVRANNPSSPFDIFKLIHKTHFPAKDCSPSKLEILCEGRVEAEKKRKFRRCISIGS